MFLGRKIMFRAVISVLLVFLMGGLVVGGSSFGVVPAKGLKILGNGPIDFAVTSVNYTRYVKNNNSVFVFTPKFIIINHSNTTIDYVSPAIPDFYLIVNVTIYANVSYKLTTSPSQTVFEFVVVDHFLEPGINNGTKYYFVKAFLFIRNPDITQLPDGKYVFTMIGPNERYNGKAYSAIITSKDGIIDIYYEYNASLAQEVVNGFRNNDLSLSTRIEYSLVILQSLVLVAIPALLVITGQGRKIKFS